MKQQKYLKTTTLADSQHPFSKRSTFHKPPEAQASSKPSVGTELKRCYMQQDWPSGTGVSSPKDREESNRREEGSNRREERREKRMVFECQASEGSPLRCTAGTSTNPED